MGLMKFLHTKKNENGALIGAERKFVEATDLAEISVVPEYTTGPEGKLILGFPDAAIAQFKKSGVLYFISWSVNFKDYEKFREIGGIYPISKLADAKAGTGLILVTISGPYDVNAFTNDHLPFSPFKTLAEIKQGMANWGSHNYITNVVYPLYLWQAAKA